MEVQGNLESVASPSHPGVRAVKACRWHFASLTRRAEAVPTLSGSSRDGSIALFEDADEAALLAVAWQELEAATVWPPASPPDAQAAWCADGELVARWSASRGDTPGCLVVVRQPLVRPDSVAQRDWVAAVLRALDGDAEPPPGLLTANFFANRDGASVLNFAEWTSAAAHREALSRGSYGRHGSIGSSALWKATREHPAITPEHEVHRYVRAGAVPG
jgi:hypothetical protein